jgi:ABC-type glutathione transport system ATPase component
LPLLQVRDLVVAYPGASGSRIPVIDGVSLDVAAGESVGVVGASGSGKTTLALSILGLLPPEARTLRGSILLRGRELIGLEEASLLALRGAELALVPQEPGIALHPQLRVGDQIAEVLRAHGSRDPVNRRERAVALLAQVGLSEPARLARAYPHELSGGQRQRVAICQAIACSPALLLADEPTSALDSTTRAEVLALLRDLKQRSSLALLLVTHDLGTLAALADRVLVMSSGRIVEEGPLERICRAPAHPATRALLAAVPRPRAPGEPRALPLAGVAHAG